MTDSHPPQGPGSDEPPADRLGEATLRRYIDHENDLLITRGEFGPLFEAYLDHVRRWESEPDHLSQTMMRQGLGAAALHLSARPFGETAGFTINVHRPPTNLFLTGDNTEGHLVGRVFTENVKPAESSRLFAQSQRNGSPSQQSTVEVEGLDVLLFFEQYYDRSEQTVARFFEESDSAYVMLLALPEADGSWLRELTRDRALGIASDAPKPLGTARFRFQCGCDSSRMMETILGLFADQPEELFRGEAGIEILCPRCGRRWWIDRSEFDEAAATSDPRGDDDEPAG